MLYSGTVLGIGSLGVLFLGLYACSRAVVAGLQRIDTGDGPIDPSPQQLKKIAAWSRIAVMVIGTVLGVILFAIYAPLTPLLEVVTTDAVWFVWPLGQGLGMGITALTVVAVVHRGFGSAIKDILEQQYTVPQRYRNRLWMLHGVLLLGMPVLVLLLYAVGQIGIWFVTGYFVLVFVWLVGRSSLVTYAYRARDPTDGERRRIADCFDRFGRSPPTTIVFDDPDEEFDVRLLGRGRTRTLLLQESLLSNTSDAELTALLASEDEKNRRYFYEQSILIFLCGLFAILVVVFLLGELLSFESINTGPNTSLQWIGVCGLALVTLVGLSRIERRTVFRTDAFATSHVDPDTVRRVYDQYADRITILGQNEIKNGIQRRLAIEPPISDRVRRIEDRHGLEPMTVTVRDGDEERDEAPGDGPDESSSVDSMTGSEPVQSDIERTLAAMDSETFADAVAALRREWGRECTIGESGAQPWIDVFAHTDDGTRELLRTIHRREDEPVTSQEVTDETGQIKYAADADSVLIVTNGRFDDCARQLGSEMDANVVDGDRLCELFVSTGLDERLERLADADR